MSPLNHIILSVLLLITSSCAYAQVNHVLNPGFETYSRCPDNADQIRRATGWSSIDTTSLIDSNSTSYCSADYCNECATYPINKVPDNQFFYQFPRSGKGMMSVYMLIDEPFPSLYPYYRDYIRGRLVKTLSAGKSYCVTFYVNLEEVSVYAIKDIGAYLDNGATDTTVHCGLPQTSYTPQVSNTSGIISDTAGWTKIQGSFIANGNERYITIGNFRNKAQTTFSVMPMNVFSKANDTIPLAQYLVDDVSIIESDLKADAGPDRHIGRGDSTYLGRPKEPGLECSWSVLGSSAAIGTGAGIWVRPATTTTYVVTQTLCGQVKRDTVKVEVWGVGIPGINGQAQQYFISPNPSKGLIQLSQGAEDKRPVQIDVFEITGKQVYSHKTAFVQQQQSLDLSMLSDGLYYIRLQDSSGHAYTLRLMRH